MQEPLIIKLDKDRRYFFNLGGYSLLMVACFATLIIGAGAISNQSLWIDELGTWRLTRADSLSEWAYQLLNWGNSDTQLPLYHGFIKIWASMFGDSELALRSSNIPWLLITLYTFWRAPVRASSISWLRCGGLVCALHPMTWYYVGEARPYVMLLAGSALAGVGLMGVWLKSENESEANLARSFLIIGLALLAATSPIGAIWTLGFIVALMFLTSDIKNLLLALAANHRKLIIICSLILLPILGQYIRSFFSGIGATALHEHKIANFMFAFYEILGLGGVGPGREELRVSASRALQSSGLSLACAIVALAPAFYLGVIVTCKEKAGGRSGCMLFFCAVPLIILLALAELKHWRVVGRHMVPLLFFYSIVLGAGINRAWNAKSSLVAKIMTLLAGVALLTSSLQVRFAERHQREMYREAAVAAAQVLAEDKIVWWFADAPGPEYYGLGNYVQKIVSESDYVKGKYRVYFGMKSSVFTSCQNIKSRGLIILENPTREMLAGCPAPARVIYSRRDTFDRGKAGEDWMLKYGLERRRSLIGFEIWE